jgi:hypothetical protein
VFVLLVPLAQASPPDPLWLPGVYDAGDFDEVVAAIVVASALLAVSIMATTAAAALAEPTVALAAVFVHTPLAPPPFTCAPPPEPLGQPMR